MIRAKCTNWNEYDISSSKGPDLKQPSQVYAGSLLSIRFFQQIDGQDKIKIFHPPAVVIHFIARVLRPMNSPTYVNFSFSYNYLPQLSQRCRRSSQQIQDFHHLSGISVVFLKIL